MCVFVHVCMFVHEYLKNSSFCWPCTSEDGTIHLCIISVPWSYSKKTDSPLPRSHQLSVAHQLQVELLNLSHVHARILTGLILCSQPQLFLVHKYSFPVIARWHCFILVLPDSGSYNLSALFCNRSLAFGRVTGIWPFLTEHSIDTLWALTSCEFLCC